jgi:glycosyltransferase involved in cell wall biosynthesis
MYLKLPPLKGGMEKHIKSLSQWQMAHGNDVILCFNGGEALSANDIKILPSIKLYNTKPNFLGIFIFYILIIIHLTIKRRSFDVLHLHGDWSSLVFSNIIKYLAGAKIVVFSMHGEVSNKFTHQKLLPYFLNKTDIVFSTGYETAKEIKKICDKNVIVQPSGVNELFFQNNPKTFNRGRKHVVTVANLFPKKNIPLVLEIAKELQDVDFDIIGDGPEYKKLITQITDYELNNVNLLGARSPEEVYESYISADCFLLTSFAEGTPTSMMEAMVVGVPIVTSNAGGVDHIVKDGHNGFVVNSMIKNDYIVKLKEILNNEELTLRISNNNQELGKSFSWDYVAAHITNITRETLNATK